MRIAVLGSAIQASDDAAWTTGTVLTVDVGIMAQ